VTPRPLPPSSYSSIVETAISPFLMVDRGGVVTWAGASIHELLGYQPGELVGMPVFDLVDPASHHAVIEVLARTERNVEQGTAPQWRSTGMVVDLLTKGGETVTCDVSGATSSRTGLDGYVVQLRRAPGSQRLRRAVEAMAAGRPVNDVLDTIAMAVSESFAETWFCILYEWDGSGFSAIAGTPMALIDVEADGSHEPPWITAVYQRTRVVIDEPESLALLGPDVSEMGLGGVAAQPVTIELMDRPAGAVLCWWMGPTRSPLLDGALTQVADQVALVLQWDQGRQALEWEANHDSLTGLGNRRAFVEDFY
jgi:PAS domain S-box-containing protein